MHLKFVSNRSMHESDSNQERCFSYPNVKHVCPLFVCSELSLKTAHEHLSTYPKSANHNKSRLFFSSAEMCKKPL